MALGLLIKNVSVVRPRSDGAETLDIGIQGGRVARLEAGNVAGDAEGQYLSRPSSRPGA